LFHNTKRPEGDNESPITDCGRVYHLWFPADILSLWKDHKVKIVMHHCGKGSFDDSLIAGKPQICMPQIGSVASFGNDMKDWLEKVKEYKIGDGVPPITFNTEKLDEYEGTHQRYENQDEFSDAFEKIKTDLTMYEDPIGERRQELLADTVCDGERTARDCPG
jgi:hypothetical protein